MIRYYKLFDLLNRQGLKKTDLRKIVSSSTIAKLGKGETVTTEVIDKICLFLDCQPNDIMEVFNEHVFTDSEGKIRKIKVPTNSVEEVEERMFEALRIEESRKRQEEYLKIKKEMEKNE